jgi:alkylation response protein AidB-like acyl-CoA dehydrogenase
MGRKSGPERLGCELEPVTYSGFQTVAAVTNLHDLLAEWAATDDAEGRFASKSVQALVDAGVFAAAVPVDLGGFGVERLHDITVITARIARADASVAVAFYMHIALAWYFARVVRFGTEQQSHGFPRLQWLEAIGGRSMLLCSAVTERGADYWNLNTTATPSRGGWIINGRKVLASASPAATHFYCRLKASIGHRHYLASAMIPADTPGVHLDNNWDGLGLRGSGSGDVVFADCPLPENALLIRGEWGRRDPRMLEGRAVSGLGLNGVYLGMAEEAHDVAVATLEKSPTGRRRRLSAASVRVGIAEMEIALITARGVLAAALQDFDAHLTQNGPQALSDQMCHGMMKVCQSVSFVVERAATDVIDHAMRLVGGSSYAARHPLARAYRDVRAAAFMLPYSPPEEAMDFIASAAPVASSMVEE